MWDRILLWLIARRLARHDGQSFANEIRVRVFQAAYKCSLDEARAHDEYMVRIAAEARRAALERN